MRSSHTLRGGRLPAALALIGLVLLGLLFVPECDDCYFVYWSFDSLRDWLLTRPSTAGAEIVGVPENGRYLGNLLGVLQGKLYFVPVVGPILRGLLMGGALWALVCLLARRARRGPVGRGESLAMALVLVLLAPRGIWQEALSWGAGLVNYLLPMVILLVLLELFARRRPSALLAGALAFCGCLFMETTTILLAAGGGLCALLFRHTDRRRAALGLCGPAAGGPGAVAGELAGRPGHVHRLRLSQRHQRRPADGRVPGPGAPAADCDRGGGVPRGGCPAHQRSAGVAGTEGGRQVEGSRPGPGPPPPAPAVAGGGELAGGTPV